jgi:guanylate kinase
VKLLHYYLYYRELCTKEYQMNGLGKIFIVSAPSGAGKTTLVEGVLSRLRPQHSIDRVVTFTTRAARVGEVPGFDFHYISVEEFEKKVSQGFFIEWSNELGDYYGTPYSAIIDLSVGKSGILVIDRIGARKIKELVPQAVLIWIKVADVTIILERLRKRGSETEEKIARRVGRAAVEIREEENQRMYPHHIENHNFDEALKNLEILFLNELA